MTRVGEREKKGRKIGNLEAFMESSWNEHWIG